MSKKQRQHEKYWGMCWAVAFGQRNCAQVQSSVPDEDPPDVDFLIRRLDGTEVMGWGELTGAYYDSSEAKVLWGEEPRNGEGGVYLEPDAILGSKARERVEVKRTKKNYVELVRRRGLGHLLVLLLSPLTTRSTRVEAERYIREQLESPEKQDLDPFETVWLGYHLPYTTSDEQEDLQYVFRDPTDGNRFNFMKRIWTSPTFSRVLDSEAFCPFGVDG